ncbi:MAG: hypothetical protein IAF38_20805, partial [Bacteroidia bacterium]|nr:hypothetical protein [Bacteroidia bacterium]
IYLMVTVNNTGGGGTTFKFYFSGQNKFSGQNDTLVFNSFANQAEAEIRAGMAETMKKGLLKYIVQTRLINKISYSVDTTEESMNAGKVKDKWNFWSFNINSDIFGNGNSYQKNFNMNYFVSASRTGEKVKTSTGSWYNMNTQEYKIDDTTIVRGFQNNLGAYHLLTFSLGKHFGWGQFASYFQSSQSNLLNSISYYPAIEYNVFPYEKATRKQLRFTYRAGIRYQDYVERTVYGKMNELYGQHSLVVQYSQIEKWGSVDISAGGWHYFNYSKNFSASVYPSINFNPAKGLRIGIWGGFNIVRDQFYLRASDVSTEEILLNQVKLKTDYTYNLGFNIGYTFGSIYNNIVNVRFELGDDYW